MLSITVKTKTLISKILAKCVEISNSMITGINLK